MKPTVLLTLTLFWSLTVSAASPFEVQCGSPRMEQMLSAGVEDGNIYGIRSLEITMLPNSSELQIKLNVLGVKMIDASNNRTTPKESTLVYKVAENKDGGLMLLQGLPENTFQFDAVFMQFGRLYVNTAGPIPPGTYQSKLSMAFVDSNMSYKNPYSMTAQKINFDCKTTYR